MNLPVTSFPCWYGKYELLGRLGTGGMAEVFLARLPGPEGFERQVVIKRILPALAHDPRMEASFIAEATLAAHVQHKNIVHVFELQRLDSGELFMTMEYVEGIDLARLIRMANKRKLRVPPWFAVKCMVEVLDGLAYAHELKDKHGRPRNIVHRDVTPSNIFISKQGTLKLGDFGVAKDETRTAKTLRGELKGKLGYLAPEQVRRRPSDRRVDIFAVGVVLWELLTQQRLFGGKQRPEIDTMNLICGAPRVAPSAIRRDVHPDLDRCVLRALQVDPDTRYQDARGFQQQLNDVLEVLNPGTQESDVRDVVAVVLGDRPAPSAMTLDVRSEGPESADHTQSDSSDNSTEIAMPDSKLSFGDVSERVISRSYSGEYPFWMRRGTEMFGPRNYWDALDWLRRLADPTDAQLSIDGEDWIALAEFAWLTGQEGLFKPAKTIEGWRLTSGMLPTLMKLESTHANGILTAVLPGGTTEITFSEGAIANVISTHPQLQMPDLLIRESILTAAELPRLIHQVLNDRRPITDAALADGWHDAEQLKARTIRLRLAPALGESPELGFRDHLEPFSSRGGTAVSPLLPVLVHEAMSARTLRILLASRMNAPLAASDKLNTGARLLALGADEQQAIARLLASGTIERWIEQHPDDEASFLYLAYLLLELGLLVARAD